MGKKGLQEGEEDRPGPSVPLPCRKASAELWNGTKLQKIQDKFPPPHTPTLCLFFFLLETTKKFMQGHGEKRKTNLKWQMTNLVC